MADIEIIGKKEPELVIPRIPVSIVRKGDKIVITCKDKKATFNPLPNSKQQYDLVTLEQFITKIAQYEYGIIVNAEKRKNKIKDEIRSAFTKTAEEATDAQIVDVLLDQAGLNKKK
jgi:hypothetical protein